MDILHHEVKKNVKYGDCRYRATERNDCYCYWLKWIMEWLPSTLSQWSLCRSIPAQSTVVAKVLHSFPRNIEANNKHELWYSRFFPQYLQSPFSNSWLVRLRTLITAALKDVPVPSWSLAGALIFKLKHFKFYIRSSPIVNDILHIDRAASIAMTFVIRIGK
jgi:hypothetical protein